jgi:hypothetical protein
VFSRLSIRRLLYFLLFRLRFLGFQSDGCVIFCYSVCVFRAFNQTVASFFAFPSVFSRLSIRRLRHFLLFRLCFSSFQSDGCVIFCSSVCVFWAFNQTVASFFALPSVFSGFFIRRFRHFLCFRLYFPDFLSDGCVIFCFSVCILLIFYQTVALFFVLPSEPRAPAPAQPQHLNASPARHTRNTSVPRQPRHNRNTSMPRQPRHNRNTSVPRQPRHNRNTSMPHQPRHNRQNSHSSTTTRPGKCRSLENFRFQGFCLDYKVFVTRYF